MPSFTVDIDTVDTVVDTAVDTDTVEPAADTVSFSLPGAVDSLPDPDHHR